MLGHLTPASLHPPFARYSHAVAVPSGYEIVFCSGQLGIDMAGAIPEGAGEQAELCFRNIEQILHAAGGGLADIVRINAFVTAREHLRPYMAVRDRLFGDPPPASTLMIVSGFAREDFKVEIEAVAALKS